MDNDNHGSGFSLPSAYQSHDSKLSHMVVLAVFFISTTCAAFFGAQIVGLL